MLGQPAATQPYQRPGVDMRTSKPGPHDPLDDITKLAPVAYNRDAQAPLWLDTVTRVTLEYDKDAQPQADLMRRCFDYNATGETLEQKFVVHYGNGANGKSTILDTVADALGDDAGTAAPGLLMAKGNDRDPTEIADLFGKRADRGGVHHKSLADRLGMAASVLGLALRALRLEPAIEVARARRRRNRHSTVGTMKLARACLTNPSMLPLTFPWPVRPKRSANA